MITFLTTSARIFIARSSSGLTGKASQTSLLSATRVLRLTSQTYYRRSLLHLAVLSLGLGLFYQAGREERDRAAFCY